MFDDYNICPYTGLRSFTEEESIYFKGRDEHIQEATKQLERNKFLMLTGASGDGKSSLVYAGIIPNARAGFIRSLYSNWQVADFRPERSPLENLSSSLAESLGINNIETVKAELGHGFSAIIDLYKSSKRYIDPDSNAWQTADETQRASLSRDGANLIILADQFEEFFTNPENYHRGAPSVESALVLNLLLETARLALEGNIPIYVIFTMRSDYIGQCAAFRGLPEYIGFSQFFVPRMNRKQLQEVIEEPAELSGNKISRRLTERLIEDITDGGDQLPMLQHALNQIWKMADSGKEEMDLIHYAMVGGISVDDLPEDHKSRFNAWFDALPNKIKVCFDEANLQNVLNTHANILNNHAAGYVKKHSDLAVQDADAKAIIKTTFQCLTKINEGRAVRNRMTLDEIAHILNRPEFDIRLVNLVLNTYRDSSNTLLKPFIRETEENSEIDGATVLDISHESLIRNWTQLKDWAKEELEDYSIYLDFHQQLERWLENDQSSDFLLSIGPLTYFEDWFKRKEPNKYWIARYEASEENQSLVLDRCEEILVNARDFLAASARKHFVTRTVMRYGPRRIAAVIALLAVLLFSSFSIKTYLERRDSAMLEFFKKETIRYANSPDIYINNSSIAILEEIRLQELTADEVIDGMVTIDDKINIATTVATQFLRQGRGSDEPNLKRLLVIADSLLNSEIIVPKEKRNLKLLIRETNDLMQTTQYAHYYSPDYGYDEIASRNSIRAAALLQEIIHNRIEDFGETSELIDLMEYSLSSKALDDSQIKTILELISPIEDNFDNEEWLVRAFPKAEIHKIASRPGEGQYGFNYNGLYQELAYFYASVGNNEKVNQIIDSLLANNSNYPNEKYLQNIDNATNIGDYFLINGFVDEYELFVIEYCQKDNITPLEYYSYLLTALEPSIQTVRKYNIDGIGFLNRHHNANLDFAGPNQVEEYYNRYRKTLAREKFNSDEMNFNMALSYKDEGLRLAKRKKLSSGIEIDIDKINETFSKALEYYGLVSESYLNESINVSRTITDQNTTISRSYLFLYPDIREPRELRQSYRSSAFLEYLLSSGEFSNIYSSDAIAHINDWIIAYNAVYNLAISDITKIPPSVFQELALQINTNYYDHSEQFALLYLILGNEFASNNELDQASKYYSMIDMDVIQDILDIPFRFLQSDILRRLAYATGEMYRIGNISNVEPLIAAFTNPINRSQIYAYAAKEEIIRNGKFPLVNILIDSSLIEAERVENTAFQPNRNLIAAALAFRNQSGDIDRAYRVIKNERLKAMGTWWISRGLAFNNDLYGAYNVIPANLADDDVCGYLYEVFHDYNRNNQPESTYWQHYEATTDLGDARIFYIR